MIIDNLTSTNIYFEKTQSINITCNNIINNKGILEQDDNKNELISFIDIGDTLLKTLENYNGTDSILFYDDFNNIKLVNNNDRIDIPLNFITGTKYLIGAKKLYGTRIKNNKFRIQNIGNLNIFKVFLDNGKEISTYTRDNDTIILNGSYTAYIDDFTKLIVYVYTDNKITGNTKFTISYNGYPKIFDKESFLNGAYFEDSLSDEIICIDEVQITQNVAKDTYRNQFEFSSNDIINNIENSVEFNLFDGDEVTDMIQYIGNCEFRLVFVNSLFNKTLIVNNCFINNGISLEFAKEKNIKKFTISAGNYIEVKNSNDSYYGKKEYGKRAYSGEMFIYNSGRRDV